MFRSFGCSKAFGGYCKWPLHLKNTFMPMCLRALPINEYVEKLRGFTTSYSTYSLSYRLPLPLRLNVFCEITSKCGRRLGRF